MQLVKIQKNMNTQAKLVKNEILFIPNYDTNRFFEKKKLKYIGKVIKSLIIKRNQEEGRIA